jgi:hypothetical protein
MVVLVQFRNGEVLLIRARLRVGNGPTLKDQEGPGPAVALTKAKKKLIAVGWNGEAPNAQSEPLPVAPTY